MAGARKAQQVLGIKDCEFGERFCGLLKLTRALAPQSP
jgi:hypothetical protein